MRARKRQPLTPIEAHSCCACRHWHRKPPVDGKESIDGHCKHWQRYWGITYWNTKTGEEQHVDWWTTGMYATCRLWEERQPQGKETA